MNWLVLIITGIILFLLLVFIVKKNRKDRKELENKLNSGYDKPEIHHTTQDPDDVKNS